jgi:hypothetical protein
MIPRRTGFVNISIHTCGLAAPILLKEAKAAGVPADDSKVYEPTASCSCAPS